MQESQDDQVSQDDQNSPESQEEQEEQRDAESTEEQEDPLNNLNAAIRAGNVKKVKSLLETHPGIVDKKTKWGKLPIDFLPACENDEQAIEILNLLVEADTYLLEMTGGRKLQCFYMALLARGRNKVFHKALEHMRNLDDWDEFELSVFNNIIYSGNNDCALHFLKTYGNNEKIKKFLLLDNLGSKTIHQLFEKGGSYNKIYRENEQLILCLLKYGIDPNCQSTALKNRLLIEKFIRIDNSEPFKLFISKYERQLLLDESILYYLCIHNAYEKIKYLRSEQIKEEIIRKTKTGNTLLHIAIQKFYEDQQAFNEEESESSSEEESESSSQEGSVLSSRKEKSSDSNEEHSSSSQEEEDALAPNESESASSDSSKINESIYLQTALVLLINGASSVLQNNNIETPLELLEKLRGKNKLKPKIETFIDQVINFLKLIERYDILIDNLKSKIKAPLQAELKPLISKYFDNLETALVNQRSYYIYKNSPIKVDLTEKPDPHIFRKKSEQIASGLEGEPMLPAYIYDCYDRLQDLALSRNQLLVDIEFSKNVRPHFYTFLNYKDENENIVRKWIALPGKNADEATKHILTILMYRAHRHGWNSARCLECRYLLAKINHNSPNFSLDKDRAALYKLLEAFESKEDYFSLNYSDDSDNEQSDRYRKQARGVQVATEKYVAEMQNRGNVYGFFTQDSELRKTDMKSAREYWKMKIKIVELEQENANKPLEPKKVKELQELKKGKDAKSKDNLTPAKFLEKIKSMTHMNVEERALIHHDPQPSCEVHNDLNELNQLIITKKLNSAAAVAELKDVMKCVGTKFFIAQYRGVHYSTKHWNADSRRAHRKHSEVDQPLFSRAVYAMSGLDATKDFSLNEQQKRELTRNAILLRHQISSLREFGGIHVKNIPFGSAGDAIQELYTRDYSGYQKKLNTIKQKCEQLEEIDDPFDVAFLFSPHGQLPTLSTGDTPYHALRYAYGIKFYDNEGGDRLRPRWHVGGQVERPYSGKVYSFLLDPAEYFSLQPNHIVSLQQEGAFAVEIAILSERETTFFGDLPAGSLIHEHIARYPSFHRDYSKHFLLKYGLNEKMYKEYHEKMISPKEAEKDDDEEIEKSNKNDPKPHSPDNQFYKFYLAEQLCAYHEVALIEDARLAAQARGGWLIYRDNHGLFSLVPPRIVPKSQIKDEDKKEAAIRQQNNINAKQAERKKQTDNQGWLAILCEKYRVRGSKNLLQLFDELKLKKPDERADKAPSVDYSTQFTRPVPPQVAEDFNDKCHFMQRYAECNNIKFVIMSALFNNDINIQPSKVSKKVIKTIELVYLGGNGFFQLVARNLAPKLSAEQQSRDTDSKINNSPGVRKK